MNVHYWPAIPLATLATLAAIAIAYVLYADERLRTANPVQPWFDEEDNISFAEHIGLNPHRWNA